MHQKAPILLVLLLAGVSLAGCIQAQATGTVLDGPDGPDGTDPVTPVASHGGFDSACTTSSGCRFWDDDLHEYVVYKVDTADIDVVIVPPLSGFALRDINTLRSAVDAWDTGIDELAAPWLRDGLQIDTYVVGQDDIPEEVLRDVEVFVVAAEYNPVLLFGIGLQLPYSRCLDESVQGADDAHAHDGMKVLTAACNEGGKTCIALNTNFLLGGAYRMYDLVAHEVGHCLGIGHVGDALDFKAKTYPVQDIMSYQYDGSQVHCVSTLNVRTLEGVYAEVLGRPSSEWLSSGRYHHMSTSDYDHVDCPNPSLVPS